ncbi:MAG TPA: cyclic nucleotide-binding domain-containing protein [Acidimicrobiales bacterium]|nr:cyclic nucleotide-binding domain-containing protein [Acidimicrobiales bacterium]
MRTATDDLAELSLFSGATRPELKLIRRNLTCVSVPAGRVLMHEGGPGNEFMIIAEGEALVSRGGRTIAKLERGDLVGEMALLAKDGVRRTATVTTCTDTRLYAGSRAEFQRIFQSVPTVATRVVETSAARMNTTEVADPLAA